jgi:hypothetical protein
MLGSEIAKKFCMNRANVFSRARELRLPPRKPVSAYNEADFRAAFDAGLTSFKLAEKFQMSRSTAYWHIRELRLSTKEKKRSAVVEPIAKSPEPTRKRDKVIIPEKSVSLSKEPETIHETPEPVHILEPVVHDQRPIQFIVPPTLKEVQRRQALQEQREIENRYKIAHKENGFTSLVNPEINNSIVSERI